MDLTKALMCICVGATIPSASATAQPPSHPTAEHKILAADEGTWDATIKSYTASPDAEPTLSNGTEVNRVLPGGLWKISKFDGDFGGTKFEGHGQFGYDASKKKYIGTWIDSLNPRLMILEGEYDAQKKTMTYVGDGIDPDVKVKYIQKMVTTTKDDGTRVFTLYMKFDKDEVKFMEITYHKRS